MAAAALPAPRRQAGSIPSSQHRIPNRRHLCAWQRCCTHLQTPAGALTFIWRSRRWAVFISASPGNFRDRSVPQKKNKNKHVEDDNPGRTWLLTFCIAQPQQIAQDQELNPRAHRLSSQEQDAGSSYCQGLKYRCQAHLFATQRLGHEGMSCLVPTPQHNLSPASPELGRWQRTGVRLLAKSCAWP